MTGQKVKQQEIASWASTILCSFDSYEGVLMINKFAFYTSNTDFCFMW